MGSPYFYIPIVSEAYRFIRRRIRLVTYSGTSMSCNVCDKHFRAFRDDEGGTCPYCGSQTRQRLLVRVLDRSLAKRDSAYRTLLFAPDWSILHWIGRHRRQFETTTADLSAPGVDLRLDITDTKLESQSYDVVLCSHVLEHVRDDGKAMRELRRLLKPTGHLFLQVPVHREVEKTDEDPTVVDPHEREVRFGQFDHIRFYGRDITARLEGAGLSVTTIYCNDIFDAGQMKKLGLWNDILFLCKPNPDAMVG